MDVNGTRFHLLLRPEEWLGTTQRQVAWDAETDAVTLAARQFVFPTRPTERRPTRRDRRGAARDRFGNWYWISDDRRSVLFQGTTLATENFWPHEGSDRCTPANSHFVEAAPPAAAEKSLLSGLTITSDHYLIVGMVEPQPGLLIFDLHAGAAPEALYWPDDIAFAPFDLASDTAGAFWVLDYDNERLWSVDRFFRVRALTGALTQPALPPTDFVPHPDTDDVSDEDDGTPCTPLGITLNMSVSLKELRPVSALETLPDGAVLLLGGSPATLHRFEDGEFSWGWRLNATPGLPQELKALLGEVHEIAVIPGQPSERPELIATVYAVAADGNQAFAFEIRTEEQITALHFRRAYHPMRRYGGKALVSTNSGAYYDALERWAPLAEQPKPLYEVKGELLLPARGAHAQEERAEWAFDGREPECVWHRLFLDACIPPGAQVMVESRAADTRGLLRSLPWQREPALYLRASGSELPFERARAGDTQGRGLWELLFQHARGRYLQLRLTLTGTSRNTPRLHALRIYYPRFSYLVEYLPDVYRDDEVSASFLDRFLANTEGFFTEWEGRIAQAQQLFDARTAPTEYLEWLADWLGTKLDLAWTERTRRLFIANAPRFFRERGTREGVRRAVQLALSNCPEVDVFDDARAHAPGAFRVRVVEKYLSRTAAGVVFGDPTEAAGLGATSASLEWSPGQGAAPLHHAYRTWLQERYTSIDALRAAWQRTDVQTFADIALPAIRPVQHAQADDWQRFLREAIGFVYATVDAGDLTLWREFLTRRYRHIADLNSSYGLTGTSALKSFGELTLPSTLPAGGALLRDWVLFVSVVVPTQRNAHRFTVLVPVDINEPEEVHQRKLELASRIVAFEKPAHTRCEVRLYWGMFRVGEARLGLESVIGQGSRFVSIVLGHTRLAEGHLAWREPWNVRRRVVVGRDRIADQLAAQTPEMRNA